MQTFKTSNRLFWTNELKSWLRTFFLATLIYIILRLISPSAEYNLTVGIYVFILLKGGNMIRQYHVKEIRVNKQNNQLTFVLKSILSGEKETKYELAKAGSVLIQNSGVKMLLSSPLILKISLENNDSFSISNRYGFTTESLMAIDDTIRNSS